VNPLGSTLHHLTIIGDEIFRVRADLQNVVQNTATAIEVEAAKHREVLQHLKNGMAGRGASRRSTATEKSENTSPFLAHKSCLILTRLFTFRRGALLPVAGTFTLSP
jgi:hypothetical protein